MAKKKGVKPTITQIGEFGAVRPIPRGRDNTDDLNDLVSLVQSRSSALKAPVGTASKSARKGAFNPTDNTAFNGNKVVSRDT